MPTEYVGKGLSRRQLLTAVSLGAAGAAGLSGCSSDGGASLSFLENKPEVIPYFDKLTAQFNKTHRGIHVTHNSAAIPLTPLLGPMNATVGIFAFIASWNDYMMPSLITANSENQSLPVVQNIFSTSLTTSYNVAFASYLMAMLPTLLVYFLAQRWILSGVTQGAIK